MVRTHCFWLAFLLSISLTGCSSTSNGGKYFENDGPPSTVSAWRASSADKTMIRLEPANKFANRPYTVMGQHFTPMTGDKPFTQTGVASWYGKQFHGKKTAIGEKYDMYAMTAAHPTMELPSYARVTNLSNGHSVIVRVNDRGPFIGNRAIDMSYAAAVKLGYQKKGTTRVRIERITRKQIASGNIPSATHTNVSLASALAANEITSTSKSTTKTSTSTVLGAVAAIASVRSSDRAMIVKEVVRQGSVLVSQYDSKSAAASASSTTSHDQTPTVATHDVVSVKQVDTEVAEIQGTIASYLPTVDNETVVKAAVGPDPISNLLISEPQNVFSAKTTTNNEKPAQLDGIVEPLLPETGVVVGMSSRENTPALTSLESTAAAWGAQIGAFDTQINAQEFAAHAGVLLANDGITEPVRIAKSSDLWCVLVGSTTQENARAITRKISNLLGTSAFASFK